MPGLMYLVLSMVISATIILTMGLGHRVVTSPPVVLHEADILAEEEPGASSSPPEPDRGKP